MKSQGQGAGPSRRSHTKSRKGCKTCKRRHIRCDETFPQCRNCTKHQVRCDYLENMSPDSEGLPSPEQPSVVLTPTAETRVDIWQQTGGFPFPDLQVYPQPPTKEYSKNELRLIEHISSISNDLLMDGNSNLTIWTQRLPKFLSIASSYPYVMHALLSFSANHLAWTHGSPETRSLQIYHGGLALHGLHDAINSFSHANADAVLAASLLMLWQATDWRSWSSLRAGTQSILSAMQSWKHNSIFAEYVAEDDLVVSAFRTHRRQSSINPTERNSTLQSLAQALQGLQIALVGQEVELYWASQLLTYVQNLQTLDAARSPEEQFNHFYHLRKWLFWVPISLLRRPTPTMSAMTTLSYFYTAALILEPLFPDLGSSFCSALALSPLEATIGSVDIAHAQFPMDPATMEMANLMQLPRQAAFNYRSRAVQINQPILSSHSPMLSPIDSWNYPTIGNISPAFAPSTPVHYTPQSASSSSAPSPWLEVPGARSGFSYGTQSWGMASPSFPATTPLDEEQLYGYGPLSSIPGFRGGTPNTDPEAGTSYVEEEEQ